MKLVVVIVLTCCTLRAYSLAGNANFLEGKTKYKAKDYRGALQDFNRSLELDPLNPGACQDFHKAEDLGLKAASPYLKQNCQ